MAARHIVMKTLCASPPLPHVAACCRNPPFMSKSAWCSKLTAPYLIIVTHRPLLPPERSAASVTVGSKKTFAVVGTKVRLGPSMSGVSIRECYLLRRHLPLVAFTSSRSSDLT